MPSSWVAIASRLLADDVPLFAAWTVRSDACRMRLSADVIVESAVESQPMPSSMFVEYWVFARCCDSTFMIEAAAAGLSDGLETATPDDASAVSWDTRSLEAWMYDAELAQSCPVVTRAMDIRSSP